MIRYLPMASDLEHSIDGLPAGSVLYISATVSPEHPLHGAFRDRLDRPPDLDFGRIVCSAGDWVRPYFISRVIDATRGGAELPEDLTPYRGIVIGGSVHRWSLPPDRLAPWQRELLRFLRRALFDERLPFLGLCGGGQIGLLALGGAVRPNPAGYFSAESEGALVVRTLKVPLTAAGRSDPIFAGCNSELDIQEAHQDWLAELPEGCRVLAEAPDQPNLVAAWRDRVRLFLPHPEMPLPFFRRLVSTVAEASPEDGTRSRLLSALPKLAPTPEANQRIVRNFLTRFCAR